MPTFTCSKFKLSGKANDEFQNVSQKTFRGLHVNTGVNGGNAKRVDVEASSNPNVAHIVEPLVNSSRNDTKAGKSSVQADEDNESDVEDIFNETGDFMAAKHSKSGRVELNWEQELVWTLE
ncbi:hypothetical protein Tco_1474843 [Tanacetum coccineum]